MATDCLPITINHLTIHPLNCSTAQMLNFLPSPLYICRESSTNSPLFMQNKPNLLNSQMNITSFITKYYENVRLYRCGENKPNSKPIKANQTQYKPNMNPKQTQNEPNQTQFLQFLPVLTLPILTTCAFGAKEMKWRRRESNPHLRDATAVCSRYTTSPKLPSKPILPYNPQSPKGL